MNQNQGFKSLLLAAAIGVSAATGAHAQDYTIRATANSNENDEDYDGLVVFENYVESASNGAIEVEIFMGTQLCSNGAECLQGVAEGAIDIYMSTSGGAAGIFPYVQVLDLPYLMRDDRVAEAVMQGDFVRTMRQMALEDSGDTIRLMTIGNTGGWRNFANTQHRIETPEDMEGLKIRTVVADLPQELVRVGQALPFLHQHVLARGIGFRALGRLVARRLVDVEVRRVAPRPLLLLLVPPHELLALRPWLPVRASSIFRWSCRIP
jgi:TRAP-type C4-dicarboxylate transport system substrate-binding protein